jgi:hypothetical protein
MARMTVKKTVNGHTEETLSLDGKHPWQEVLHVAVTNHRSRKNYFDFLVREVIRIGNELA